MTQSRPRGRPSGPKHVDLHVLLPPALVVALDAQRHQGSRLELIRQILTEWVQARQQERDNG